MSNMQDVIKNLNDNQAVMLLNNIHNRIFNAVDFDDLEKNIKDNDVGKILLELSDEQLNVDFDANISVDLTREFLTSIVKDENFSELIKAAWEEVKNDDAMMVGTIIAVGLMVNLTLFMVSSKFEIDINGMKFSKDKVDTEAVKAIMGAIGKISK